MAEFNFDDLKKTISDAAEVATRKAGDFVSIQKLKGQIYTLERSVDKKYQELGAIVFEEYAKGEKINDESAVVCEEISQVNANISELREELASKHGCKVCSVCEAEVPTDAMFCMKCGAQMPEEKCDCSEPGCTCEDVKEEAKDVGEAVIADAGEAVDKAEDAIKDAGEKVAEKASEVADQIKEAIEEVSE